MGQDANAFDEALARIDATLATQGRGSTKGQRRSADGPSKGDGSYGSAPKPERAKEGKPVHSEAFASCPLCSGPEGRPTPTQEARRLRGAVDELNRAAKYVNEDLLAKGVINREQQHQLLWPLRVAYMVVKQTLEATPLWEGHATPTVRGVPLDW